MFLLKDRIKKLRKTLDLTQHEFGERIGSTQNAIGNYETGHRNPSSSVINNICKTFNVNEIWLRTGEGEMFLQASAEDELASAVNRLLSGESSAFKTRLIQILADLGPREWDILESYALKLAQKQPASGTREASPREMSNEELHAELDRQLTEEKKAEGNQPASGRGNSGMAAG